MTGFIMRRLERKIEAWQRELTDTHLREVESMYTQMRSWRHDTRNHIQTMKALVQEGDLPEIRRYLDQLEAELHTIEPAVRTGNSMADAILKIMDDPALLKRLSDGARRLYREKFTARAMTAQLERMYEAAYARSGGKE